MNPRVPGYFLHEAEGEGWTCNLSHVDRHPLFRWREKQIFTLRIDDLTPLTFIQDDGTQIRCLKPGESMETDFGSIPSILQSIVRKEGVEYLYHDAAYKHGALWIKEFGGNLFHFVKVSRAETDRLLRTMSQCTAMSPRGVCKSTAIWSAVRLFGWACGFNDDPIRHDPYPAKREWEKQDVDDCEVGA